MPITLSLRLNEGDMFIKLENESFSADVRKALKAHLPEVVCAPISDERIAFLKERRNTMSLFSLPFNTSCPVTVVTTQGRERSSGESTAALRGLLMALREVFKGSPKS